ncbi:MAG: methionine adenosyltransferase [Candidatus Cloacimonadaceae bacterium]
MDSDKEIPCRRRNEFVFTSESVSEGHPDKVCDQISDAILDEYLSHDPTSRVACETMATANHLIIAGEITSRHKANLEKVARQTIREIGYTVPGKGFDDNCEITNLMHKQESALKKIGESKVLGAGDQGLMFGYACDQTRHLMPIPIAMAHKLLQKLAKARKDGSIPELLPDAKSQVTFKFLNRLPKELMTIVISTHHHKITEKKFKAMKDAIIELVVMPAINEIEEESIHSFQVKNCEIKINPLGMWVDGGPAFDTGLTGRKIIVDTYGGWASHGGGAFSGKDPTKVDRSASYMARYIAKNIVDQGVAKECLIQFSFIIGEPKPISLMVHTYGTGIMPDKQIEQLILDNFDLTVKGIIDQLKLRRPIYRQTACYGHFGRLDLDLSWEKFKKLKF